MTADRDHWRDRARRVEARNTVAAAARRLRAMRDVPREAAGQGRMWDGP